MHAPPAYDEESYHPVPDSEPSSQPAASPYSQSSSSPYSQPSSSLYSQPSSLSPYQQAPIAAPSSHFQQAPAAFPSSRRSRHGRHTSTRGSTDSPAPVRGTPACFSHQAPPSLPYPDFQPTFLIANGDGEHIHKGFPIAVPPSTAYPHPFESHGVLEVDWRTFLEDILSIAALSDEQRSRASLPIVAFIPIVNVVVREGLKGIMKSRKVHPICKLLHTWNHHYFNSRRMEVILMQGNARIDQESAPLPKGSEKEGYTAAGSNLNFDTKDKTFRLVVRAISQPSC
ncbi:hypothetical protein BD626DRAFT_407486 [Schizophyllum amplum]|uniref:Uncharacterized protein n=1 Tax=Schizophyllum amplum TaxID=97359 RepID=A0A550C6B4_9AGAR|nr:hypothetical protein BD626DRAFT_407486 [Auriculariopsis ampla]